MHVYLGTKIGKGAAFLVVTHVWLRSRKLPEGAGKGKTGAGLYSNGETSPAKVQEARYQD
jgi:hypothetical protein